MDIQVRVYNQKLSITTNLKTLISGTQEFIRFIFDLPEDWDNLTIFAQFRQDDVAYNQYLDENKSAYLPSEIKPGQCTLMLYGVKDSVVATTNFLTLTINKNNLILDAQSTNISESLYSQLVSKVNEMVQKFDALAIATNPDASAYAEVINARSTYATLNDRFNSIDLSIELNKNNFNTFAAFPNQSYNIIKNHTDFLDTSGWSIVNTGTLTAENSLLKAVSKSSLRIYANLEKSVSLNASASILVKIRVRCTSGGTATVKPCWRAGSSGVVIDKSYIVAGNVNTSDMTWTLGSTFTDLWLIAKDGTAQATIDRVGLLISSGSTVEVAHFEVYYSEDDIKTNLSTLANNDYVEYNCTPELVKYRYFNGTMVETTGYTSALFKLPPDTKRVKITMSTIINAHKYTFIDSSGAILKYGVSMYTSESDAVFYVDVPKDAYACICSNNASLCSSITLTALKNNVKDTFNDITQKSNTTLLSANLYINGDKWTDGFLDNWFSRMNAVGVKNITLVVTPIMGNDGNFKLRQNEFELLDRYIAKYQFNIATIKFSNKLIASGRFSDYQQDFGNEEIRTKYINFVEATLKKLVYAYSTIEKCFAINEAAYWYRPTNGDYTSQKMYMCQSIINKCNAIVPTGISFAGFWDYLTCSNGVVPLLKKYGVIGINHYQPLTADINRTMIPTAIDSYDTWKNQIVKAGFERLKNDGFTNICISETGICDFIESMYDVFAESTGTTANGEVQAIYWDGLLRLIKNDCPYVSDISMWYAEYLNSSSDKVVSVFRKWFNGGVSNG